MNQRDLTYARWTAIVGAGFALLAAVLQYWPSSNALEWLSIDEARSVAVKQRKPIFMDIYAPWCGPCKNLDKETWADSSVQAAASRFVCIKVNVDEDRQTAAKYGADAIPLVVVLGPDGSEITRNVGFIGPAEMLSVIAKAGAQ